VTPPDLVVAGWPLALTFAAALAGERLTVRRRRMAANHALHELRRPLQAMVLMEEARTGHADNGMGSRTRAAGPLDSAIVAVGDLERVINGGGGAHDRRPVSCEELIAAAIARWEPLAARLGVRVRPAGPRQSGTLLVDPRRLDQALDNLIANAIEHGGPLIEVGARVSGGQARIAVRDSGVRDGGRPTRPAALPVLGGGRGNGLRIVGSVARSHEGRFAFHRSPFGSVAIIDLPLAAPPAGAA
jgi:signal transduction histidine kinase